MNPVLVEGVLWVPNRAEGPGWVGDYMAPLDPSDPEYDVWMAEAVQAEPGVVWSDEPLTAAAWDESKVNRQPKGVPIGGQFAVKVGQVYLKGEGAQAQVYHAGERASTLPAEIAAWKEEEPRSYAQKAYSAAKEPDNNLIVVRRDGDLIGVGQFTYMGPDQDLVGGYFGAVKGGGLPLFNAFLEEAEKRGVGASWEAGNERSQRLYDRLNIPKPFEPTPEEYEQDADKELYPTYADYYDAWNEEFGYSYRLDPAQVRLLSKDMFALARSRTAALEAMVAAGWVEADHPRDPGGEGGGQFIQKGTSAEGAPAMGLGTAEERQREEALNDVPFGLSETEKRKVEESLKVWLDQADLSMRVPEEALLEILTDGEFYNQHHEEAGSRGLQRDPRSEAKMLGLPGETLPDQLPKYAYLGQDNDQVNMYGPLKVVFKPEVKERTTFTFGDSLMHRVIPSPVTNPSWMTASAAGIANDKYNPGHAWVPENHDYDELILENDMAIPYAEAQIYGRLTPDDIDHVEVLSESYWDEADPMTGVPLVTDRSTMEAVVSALSDRAIRWYEYEPEGDFSGEWA